MKRVLITGEYGFIGTSLAAYLAGFLDRYETERIPLRSRAPETFDFHGADAVIHVAAIVHQKDTERLQPLYDAVNRDLTLALAEKAKREGVGQFVFFSSIGIYGMETGVIDETTQPNPKTRYDRSKLEAEQRIAQLADETFSVTILRSPVVFGPGAKGNPARLRQLAKALPVCPDFENRRSMVSIETLCGTVKALIDAPRSGIFFPQEPKPVATSDLIARAMTEQGRTVRRSRILNPAIRVLRVCTHAGKKAFGDLVYTGPFERELSTDGEETEI